LSAAPRAPRAATRPYAAEKRDEFATSLSVANLDAAAARFIKRANAPWPRKFAGNGVEVMRVFKAAENSRDAGGDREWRVLRDRRRVTRRAGRGAREDDQ